MYIIETGTLILRFIHLYLSDLLPIILQLHWHDGSCLESFGEWDPFAIEKNLWIWRSFHLNLSRSCAGHISPRNQDKENNKLDVLSENEDHYSIRFIKHMLNPSSHYHSAKQSHYYNK